jgi:hypothetical protein
MDLKKKKQYPFLSFIWHFLTNVTWVYVWVYGIQRHFQQNFNYIVAVSFIETGVPGENHRPLASYWQTVSDNVASSTRRHERGLNFSGDRH